MSAHGPMPRSAWIFPALAVTLFAATTALGFTFTPSPSGLVFAAALLVICSAPCSRPSTMPR